MFSLSSKVIFVLLVTLCVFFDASYAKEEAKKTKEDETQKTHSAG